MDVSEPHTKSQIIVVTGVNGFVGKHLARELHTNGIKVIGVGRELCVDDEITNTVDRYISVDLTARWPEVGPIDAVIHLAGLAAVGPSFEHPQDYINVNSTLITNMGEYFLKSGLRPRLVIVSSGAIYDPKQPLPLTEESVLGMNSPYVVSKLLVEKQCEYYRNRGLDFIVLRPFNHIGPGQGLGFLVPDIISGLKKGGDIIVGNLETRRDYTDVRDIVRAYRMVATQDSLANNVYNLCSGKSLSGREVLDILISLSHRKDVKVNVDSSKIRPNDPAEITGDNTLITRDTGWKPRYSIEDTLKDSF